MSSVSWLPLSTSGILGQPTKDFHFEWFLNKLSFVYNFLIICWTTKQISVISSPLIFSWYWKIAEKFIFLNFAHKHFSRLPTTSYEEICDKIIITLISTFFHPFSSVNFVHSIWCLSVETSQGACFTCLQHNYTRNNFFFKIILGWRMNSWPSELKNEGCEYTGTRADSFSYVYLLFHPLNKFDTIIRFNWIISICKLYLVDFKLSNPRMYNVRPVSLDPSMLCICSKRQWIEHTSVQHHSSYQQYQNLLREGRSHAKEF